jgi:hypothetical protein
MSKSFQNPYATYNAKVADFDSTKACPLYEECECRGMAHSTTDEAFWKAHSRMRGGPIIVDGALSSTINPARRSSKLNHNLQTLNNTGPGFLFPRLPARIVLHDDFYRVVWSLTITSSSPTPLASSHPRTATITRPLQHLHSPEHRVELKCFKHLLD